MIKNIVAKVILIWKLWIARITFDSSYHKMEKAISKTSKSEYIINHTLLK